MDSKQLELYGANWCGDCRRTKKFLGEQRIHYRWIDITDNDEAIAFVEKMNDGKRRIPTLVLEGGEVLSNPSNAELATALGLETTAKMSYYDTIIVGSGPAGLTAALYLAREGYEVLVIEKSGLGGQTGITDRLDNFPGFPEGINGGEFADRLVQQAKRFGVEILQAQAVTGLRAEAESRYVRTSDGREYGAKAVIVATGSTYRRLEVPGEEELLGAGVHFCATCDGPFYKGEHVAVVGGGSSAAEESLFLTRFADKVTLLVRGEALKTAPVVIDKIRDNAKIEVRYQTEVRELRGANRLEGLVIGERGRDASETLEPAALFLFVGLTPNSDWLPGEIERTEHGFLCTDRTLETSIPGVFAAGDVRAGATNQAASAAGEGTTVALMVREYLKAA
ncbi:MAG: FAD-dependent oxidoreductase [Acidobacteriota bacterium]